MTNARRKTAKALTTPTRRPETTTPMRKRDKQPLDLMLTPELCDRICAGIARGLHPHVAAEFAGVSARMFESWIEEGKKGTEPYATFRTAIVHADAKLHSQVIGPLVDGLETNPSMALKFAERRWPNEWAPPCPQKDEAAFHQAFQINIHLSHEEGGLPATGCPPAIDVTPREQPPQDRIAHTLPAAVPAPAAASTRAPSRIDEWNAEIRGRGLGYVMPPPAKKRPENGGNGDPSNWN
jgi:hypothetical protein